MFLRKLKNDGDPLSVLAGADENELILARKQDGKAQ